MARNDRKKKHRRRGWIDIANGLLSLLVIGLILVGGAVFFALNQFNAPGATTTDTTFLVARGASFRSVADDLVEQKIVPDWQLLLEARGLVFDKPIQAGEFVIPAGASLADIYELMTEGKAVEYFVMVNPGDESFLVAEKLNDPAQNLAGEAVAVPPEGSILPVRHDYFPRDGRADLLKRMQDEMTAAVDAAWAKCRPDVCGEGGPIKSKEELVILASLVEEETGLASERPIVASLFLNRLRDGERLETDPTIIYGLFKGQPQASRIITASQKASETPYNTYVIPGLPPTPITNPGIAALEAVANPAETNFKFMMAITPGNYADGHAFAATLAEHNANVARYREQERARVNGEPAVEPEDPADATGDAATPEAPETPDGQ